jgi:hypothetical protein
MVAIMLGLRERTTRNHRSYIEKNSEREKTSHRNNNNPEQ